MIFVRQLFLTLAFACLAFPANSQANELIIVSSNSKSLVEGSKLPPKFEIKLKKNEVVRVMSRDGNMYKFKGPFRGNLDNLIKSNKKSGKSIFDELSNVFFERGQSKDATGASRGGTGKITAHNPQNIDISWGIPSIVCLSPKQHLVLKGISDHEQAISVEKNGNKQSLNVKDGQLTFPKSLFNSKPRRIRISSTENNKVFSVTLRYSESLLNPGEQLSWFRKSSCKQQLNKAIAYYQSF
ncbi:hypothetical protein [Pseudoteredinibacter isoporae]|uniref:Uncharacterized protein n=1 Tax=Pseudoteredinibacter isoporae TaxID=570281 RepID=A0A7X0MYT6_9GAMM|nr:hypothetical protein [Pseudoteredinibacter isoporae]MBB6523429.1 hypothetical protein [Pseudoteredinibacter isoporae]NHO88940.1 hypothetical protein [Pseudoteredinibacter isoporae]NIB24352.1 hypothetical protein [Pseudoteredinibacter isoporae]